MPGNSNGNDSAEAFIEDAMSSLDRTALERNNVIELVVKKSGSSRKAKTNRDNKALNCLTAHAKQSVTPSQS